MMDRSERSEEFMIAPEYILFCFDAILILKFKKACFNCFSFDSHSTNDELQPQIIFFYACY
jgi:hypothetical protein